MDDDAKAEAGAIAERRVRLGLLLTEIGRSTISRSARKTRARPFEEARRYPGQEQQVLEYFQQNQQAMQQLAGPIFEDKTVDFILEMANVTEVATDVETLRGPGSRNAQGGVQACRQEEGGEKGRPKRVRPRRPPPRKRRRRRLLPRRAQRKRRQRRASPGLDTP